MAKRIWPGIYGVWAFLSWPVISNDAKHSKNPEIRDKPDDGNLKKSGNLNQSRISKTETGFEFWFPTP
jgi:hypothetical protein